MLGRISGLGQDVQLPDGAEPKPALWFPLMLTGAGILFLWIMSRKGK